MRCVSVQVFVISCVICTISIEASKYPATGGSALSGAGHLHTSEISQIIGIALRGK